MKNKMLFILTILFIIININICSFADISDGLVAYYKFEDNVEDSSGFGNHGVKNGNIQYVNAVIGKGIKFFGVNSEGGTSNPDYIMIKNSDSLKFNDAFSVSYFSKIDGDQTQTSENCSGDIIDGIYGTVLGKSGDRSGFYFVESEFRTGFGINPYQSGKGLSSEELSSSIYKTFRHTAYVINWNNIKIYVNGMLVKESDGVVDFAIGNSNDLYLGVQQNSTGACFPFWYPLNGVVDELRIYNRPLSDTEVMQIYNDSDSYQPIFHYDFENGLINLVSNQDEKNIVENSETVVIEDGQLKLINNRDHDPQRNISRVIDTSNISKLLIEKRSYIVPKGQYSLSSVSLSNNYDEQVTISYNYYHYSSDPQHYLNRDHFYIINFLSNFSKNDPDTYLVSNLLETQFSQWIDELIEIDYLNKKIKYEYIVDENKQTANIDNFQLKKDRNTKLSLYAWDWANGSSHYIDSIKVSAQYEINGTVSGKIITDANILGYTASVGGASITALSHEITCTTDIYGNFILNNVPTGDCIIEIESSYFKPITIMISVNTGENLLKDIKLFKPKCGNTYSQKEVDQMLDLVKSEKDNIISEKENIISELSSSMASMYTQGYLDKAIIEAEKRGELKYDINQDGKVGLEEVIKYLETLSGVRIESLIIFPE